MQEHHNTTWATWSERLKARGLNQFAAALLDATRPLTLAGAQLVYFGQPLMHGLLPEGRSAALAALLEDPQAVDHFIDDLRQEEPA